MAPTASASTNDSIGAPEPPSLNLTWDPITAVSPAHS